MKTRGGLNGESASSKSSRTGSNGFASSKQSLSSFGGSAEVKQSYVKGTNAKANPPAEESLRIVMYLSCWGLN
ncbi:hypothetical protein DCAR_0104430 [Daucus carota subsp. sativus]|uniref:Uncharacterized protein n=1 Tax=Daucus carota subsp. sativus TaxID=79200 RepID=A0A166IU72_DAUCS|nr:hypothetical protein DCAR_0104430 [Daucus carota subsp. sativus]